MGTTTLCGSQRSASMTVPEGLYFPNPHFHREKPWTLSTYGGCCAPCVSHKPSEQVCETPLGADTTQQQNRSSGLTVREHQPCAGLSHHVCCTLAQHFLPCSIKSTGITSNTENPEADKAEPCLQDRNIGIITLIK